MWNQNSNQQTNKHIKMNKKKTKQNKQVKNETKELK